MRAAHAGERIHILLHEAVPLFSRGVRLSRAQHFGREVNRALSDVAAHFFLFHRFEPPGLQHFADREVKIRE